MRQREYMSINVGTGAALKVLKGLRDAEAASRLSDETFPS